MRLIAPCADVVRHSPEGAGAGLAFLLTALLWIVCVGVMYKMNACNQKVMHARDVMRVSKVCVCPTKASLCSAYPNVSSLTLTVLSSLP